MKILLRSCFMSGGDEEKHVIQNITQLRESGLGFEQETDSRIWDYITEFTGKYHHPPSLTDIRGFFQGQNADEVINRSEYLAQQKPRIQGGFLQHLEAKAKERRTIRVADILSEAGNILRTGVQIKHPRGETEILQGPVDTINYIMDNSREIVAPTTGQMLSGTVNDDVADFMSEYRRTRDDPSAGKGQLTGIAQIDDKLPGAKRHELWIHAAFTGGMKSTFIINWAYNQAVGLYGEEGHNPGKGSLIFSLEMPYHQVRRMIFVMHSTHPKWREKGIPALDYQRVRDGELTPQEEVYLETIAEDFGDPANNYGKIHIEVPNPDSPDFKVSDVKSKAEVIYAREPFHMVFVDHVGLMAPRKWVASTTERLNEVIRDLKRLAMSFNRGAGIGVVALFQINREGYKAALKVVESARKSGDSEAANRGKYNLTHLSYANEAERSADIITTTWIDEDLRQKNWVQFQCLKTRDQEPFIPFHASVSWMQRRLTSLDDLTLEEARAAGDQLDDELDIDHILGL